MAAGTRIVQDAMRDALLNRAEHGGTRDTSRVPFLLRSGSSMDRHDLSMAAH